MQKKSHKMGLLKPNESFSSSACCRNIPPVSGVQDSGVMGATTGGITPGSVRQEAHLAIHWCSTTHVGCMGTRIDSGAISQILDGNGRGLPSHKARKPQGPGYSHP